jgi:hypothetical protein
MNDGHYLALNPIVDDVGITADPKRVNTVAFDDPRAPWLSG